MQRSEKREEVAARSHMIDGPIGAVKQQDELDDGNQDARGDLGPIQPGVLRPLEVEVRDDT
jgi:hypothetical protein